MSFLAEQAGGKVLSDGKNRILDIIPEKLHQRSPYFVGTCSMVEKAESFMAEFPTKTEVTNSKPEGKGGIPPPFSL